MACVAKMTKSPYYSFQKPLIVWRETVAKLDYPEFIIHNKAGLRLLMQGLFRCCLMDIFPVEIIYQSWKNTEGQVMYR